MASTSKTTTDHETIRRWAEKRKAVPTTVARTRSAKDVGVIRLDFPGFSGEGSLAAISWDEFFDKFDDEGLAFVFQEKTAAGKRSNFNRFVKREGQAKRAGSRRVAAPKRTTSKRAAARTTKRAAAPKRTTKRAAEPKRATPRKAAPKRTTKTTAKRATKRASAR